MREAIEAVAVFHRAFGCVINETPAMSHDVQLLQVRDRILREEVDELFIAGVDGDPVALLDALADCLFVLLGTAHTFGVASYLPAAFDEVCRSNMSKLGADGRPVLREDGKVLKGPSYSPPDIAALLDS